MDQGWSNAELGQLTLISSLAGIGALLGGVLYARLGALRSLLLFGALQAVGIAAMAVLVSQGAPALLVYAVALFEQCADGMSTVALFAVMMSVPRRARRRRLHPAGLCATAAGWCGGRLERLAKGYPALFQRRVLACWRWRWSAITSPGNRRRCRGCSGLAKPFWPRHKPGAYPRCGWIGMWISCRCSAARLAPRGLPPIDQALIQFQSVSEIVKHSSCAVSCG